MRKFTMMMLAAVATLGFVGCENPNKTPDPIAVEEITFSPATLSLVEGETGTITATVLPADADDNTIEWSTSDAAIATVDQAGLVTAVKEGTATITATALDGSEVKQDCAVTVSALVIPVTEVTLDSEAETLSVGQTLILEATVLPEEATDKAIVWSSSDEAIATVDAEGLVTALAQGAATITATSAQNGEITATCELTIVVPVASITITPESLALTLGETATLTAEVLPADATNAAFAWTVEGTAVTIDENGLVTTVEAGSATITATAADGAGATASIAVTVSEPVKYAVGDLYPNAESPMGVVFCIENDGLNGKVVALQDITGMPWGDPAVETPADQLNGLVTFASIQAADAAFASFPVFTSINNLNAPGTVYAADSKGVWYLPAIKELRQLYAGMSGLTWVDGEGGGIVDGVVTDWGNGYSGMVSWSTPYEEKAAYEANRATFNATIVAAGGAKFTYENGNFWSATQCFEGQANYVYCFECYSASTVSNTSKTDSNNLARPIMAF